MSKHTMAVASALLAASVAVLSACTADESADEPTASGTGTSSPPPGTERLTTQLTAADGTPVADAIIDFANGYATVTVETVAAGILTPGFHGLHIHSMGKCEADSVAPTGGQPSDFNSAGGHYRSPGNTGQPANGDLTSLEVRSDGSAKLVTTTDRFDAADLRGSEGSALIIHADADNFANIPPRYTINGTPGPDEQSLATGDAGQRVACGVIAPAAATNTSTSTSTVTSTITPTTATEVPTTTAQPPPAPSGTTTNTTPGTTPSTATSPAPAVTTTTAPAPG